MRMQCWLDGRLLMTKHAKSFSKRAKGQRGYIGVVVGV